MDRKVTAFSLLITLDLACVRGPSEPRTDIKAQRAALGSAPAGAPLGNIRALGAGITHACAVTNDGAVRCWGLNPAGRPGSALAASSASPSSCRG